MGRWPSNSPSAGNEWNSLGVGHCPRRVSPFGVTTVKVVIAASQRHLEGMHGSIILSEAKTLISSNEPRSNLPTAALPNRPKARPAACLNYSSCECIHACIVPLSADTRPRMSRRSPQDVMPASYDGCSSLPQPQSRCPGRDFMPTPGYFGLMLLQVP